MFFPPLIFNILTIFNIENRPFTVIFILLKYEQECSIRYKTREHNSSVLYLNISDKARIASVLNGYYPYDELIGEVIQK